MFPSRASGAQHLFVIDVLGHYGAVPNTNISVASAVFPGANKVFYMPLRVPVPVLIRQLYCLNGSVVSGNVDVGLFTLDGTKIISSGSTAQAGTTTKQLFNVTDTLIGRGCYYLGITLSNTTGTFQRITTALAPMSAIGLLTETTGGFGLPAIATFSTLANAYMPLGGLLAQTVM